MEPDGAQRSIAVTCPRSRHLNHPHATNIDTRRPGAPSITRTPTSIGQRFRAPPVSGDAGCKRTSASVPRKAPAAKNAGDTQISDLPPNTATTTPTSTLKNVVATRTDPSEPLEERPIKV